MKKVVSILLAMTIVCSLFTGCVTNNNSTSDTSPAGNSTTTNDTKTYRMALIQPQNNLDYFNFITASAQKYADANGIELTVWQQNSDQAKGGEFVDMKKATHGMGEWLDGVKLKQGLFGINYLVDCVAYAGIGHLDVQHLAHGGGDIDDAGRCGGLSVGHLPSHKYHGDV